MKPSYLPYILVCLFLPVLLGMGSQSSGTPEKIPIPAKKFTATFVDQMDITTECGDVSIEGRTFVDGKKGEGSYTVSFMNIQSVVFRVQEEKLFGAVRLTDGSTIELLMNKKQRAYGNTKFGTFQIQLADLKKIIFK